MTSTTWKRAKQVFHEALDKSGPDRRGFVATTCGEDRDLRLQVEALLSAHDEAGEFLASPTAPESDEATRAAATLTSSSPTERPGASIGPYKLLQVIGEGGFGVVYMAEQEEPVRRRVALKIIKLGMDTKQVIARFEAERQALALMEHPNIARVLDAGATETGRPYFVMELVKGVPITEYCDTNLLATRERLDLFTEICSAVQHAHQKGIVHRDIKPSNVLVTLHDGKPVPKVIDFGIAKATHQRLTEKTLFTAYGQFIGTPVYMSPEQAEMSGLDVDTRSDIYSLGVLLYELLTETTPFDVKALREAGYAEIQRIIREEEPPRPSTRLSTLGGALTAIAKHRKTDPGGLTRLVRGDLDWIVMKALEKDRRRRYGSPNELAADIGRHLSHQPVVAGPPTTVYRTTKFLRKHRGGVMMVLAAVALLLGLAVRERIQANRIARERDRANLEAERAATEAETAKQVSEFLTGLFEISDPNEALGNTITAREILDKGAQRVQEELRDQPLVQARLMHTMGEVYASLGLREQARDLLERALQVREDTLGENHLDVAESLNSLAELIWIDDEGEAARSFYERALEIREKILGPDHVEVAKILPRLGWMHQSAGDLETAGSLYERALEIQERTLGAEHPDVATTLSHLATLASWTGDVERAQSLYERALAIKERAYGPDDPRLTRTLMNYAWMRRDDPEVMLSLCERALTISEKVYGPKHPTTADTAMVLANALLVTGDFEQALGLMKRTVAIREEVYGPDHTQVAIGLRMVGSWSYMLGHHDVARPALERALRIFEEAHGPEAYYLSDVSSVLGNVMLDAGDFKAARSLFDKALAQWEKAQFPDSREAVLALWGLAKLHRAQGESSESEALFEQALEITKRMSGEESAEYEYARARYYALIEDRGEALRLLREAGERQGVGAEIAVEPDLASLRGDPEFEAIVAEVKAGIE